MDSPLETFGLSLRQRRHWILNELDPGSPSHHVALAWRLVGPLRVGALEAALTESLKRHEILRATFGLDESGPVGRIGIEVRSPLVRVDMRALPPGEGEPALRRLLQQEARRPFDLQGGPLLRGLLVELGDEAHVLALIAHQIVADRGSLATLFDELASRAPAAGEGRRGFVAPADGERAWVQTDEAAARIDFWRRRLAGVPPLDLPPDRPRPIVRNSRRGAAYPVEMPAPLVDSLSQIARREGCSLSAVLLAGFAVMLHRWSGQGDLSVGVPVDGRSSPELARVVGPLSDWLPVRVSVGRDATFRALIRESEAALRDARVSAAVPFGALLDALNPARDTSRTPLFQVTFEIADADPGVAFPGLEVSAEHVPLDAAPFDLGLALSRREGVLQGALTYDSSLFEAATIARIAEHLTTLLAGAAVDPDRRAAALPLMTQEQRRTVLFDWNRTAAELPPVACVHDLIAAQAARSPDAAALTCGEETLTYRALEARVDALASRLRAAGVGPEVLVAILIERGIDLVIALLAVLRAGGAYVPLDPTYPRERLAYMLDDARPAALLVRRAPADLPAPRGAHIIDIDDPGASPGGAWGGERPSGTGLAYVIYTSGSTGKPVGVQVTRRAVVNFLRAMAERPGVTAGDVLLAVTTVSFDIAGLELYLPLTVGARVVLAPRSVAADGAALRALVEEVAPTVMQATPATWRMLLEAGWTEGAGLKILCGGEALAADLAERLRATGADVWNLYGPTETTIWSTLHHVDAPQRGAVPIGRPIANTTAYVLDADLEPVPPGTRGMLYLGGEGVARGYLRRPDLTASKFVPDPFRGVAGARMFRTGDEARFSPDGALEFLGRSDFQVKVRGFRIELGEVEAALAGHPAVLQAVVVARDDAQAVKRLVAYVVPRHPGPPPTQGALREHLLERLPDFMVPAAYVVLDALPLTPAGKIDRRGLPAPDPGRRALAEEVAAPRTPVEGALARIWAEVLGLPRVGIHDDFFELGGDSLLAVRVASRAGQQGIRISPGQLVQRPTVERLAEAAEIAAGQADSQERPAGEAPLTPIQLVFLSERVQEPHHFTMSLLLEIADDTEPALLEAACRAVIEHHDALRLRFTQRPVGGWTQAHKPSVSEEAFWQTIDLSSHPEEEVPMAIAMEANRVNASIDLAHGPLLRAALLRLGPRGPFRFLLACHHLVMDEISQSILLEDIQAAYEQLARGAPIRLPVKTMSYQRWAQRLSEHAQSASVLADFPYWQGIARRARAPLPTDELTGPPLFAGLAVASMDLSVDETRAVLRALPRQQRVTVDDVLLTGIALGMESLTGRRSLLVSAVRHGRDAPIPDVDVSRTVGYFVQPYVVWLDASESASPLDALRAIQGQLRAAVARSFSYGPLRFLSDDASIREELAAIEPEIAYVNSGHREKILLGAPRFRFASEFAGLEYSPNNHVGLRLILFCHVSEGRLQILFVYSENTYRAATIERVAGAIRAALASLIAASLACSPVIQGAMS
ncbi:amino acid adenylation domain-containing protein [Sorangium sp. So ce204]|uniref:amino acid adenylation domain-containing protein n=1 Tax=Sorangium sp. So ce204 TaxID=3133288 RepID=UPI003F5F1894